MTAAAAHQLLTASGERHLIGIAADVVRRALASGCRPVVVAPANRFPSLRSQLGDLADQAVLWDMAIRGRNPARVLATVREMLDAAPGAGLEVFCEPVTSHCHPQRLGEIVVHEMLLSLPRFAQGRLRTTCTVDVETLRPDVHDALEEVHQALADDSAEVEDRLGFAFAEPLSPRPRDVRTTTVDRTTLDGMRGAVRTRGLAAGLDEQRADDVVYAVNEAVTNSICHGEGRATLAAWTEQSEEGASLVFEVSDRGWIRDPLVGRLPPRSEATGGRGLWLIHQLCDLAQVRSSPAGTTVRMWVDLAAAPTVA